MMRLLLAPSARAAVVYSWPRASIVWARTIRAESTHPRKTLTNTTPQMPVKVSAESMAMPTTMKGSAKKTSIDPGDHRVNPTTVEAGDEPDRPRR